MLENKDEVLLQLAKAKNTAFNNHKKPYSRAVGSAISKIDEAIGLIRKSDDEPKNRQQRNKKNRTHHIYLIRRIDESEHDLACSDQCDSHVIIADTPKEAREMCPKGDECGEWGNPWLDEKQSTVTHLGKGRNKKGVVLSSFNAA